MEKPLVLGKKGLEVIHVTRLNACYDLIVGEELLFEIGVGKDLTIGNISHQKLNDNLKLHDLKSECLGSNFGALSLSLDQTRLGL